MLRSLYFAKLLTTWLHPFSIDKVNTSEEIDLIIFALSEK